jgi:hypothetical protein
MFNSDKFKSTNFVMREKFYEFHGDETLEVMKTYFDNGETPGVMLRGLTGKQYSECKNRHNARKNIEVLVTALAGDDTKKIGEELKKKFGDTDETTPEISFRMKALELGSDLDWETVGTIKHYFPVEFNEMTDIILNLTGMGAMPGELKASGASLISK